MAITKKEVSKTIKLDLTNVPVSERASVKNDVGEYVVNAILKKVQKGKTPVSGAKNFAKLNPSYANTEKGGDRTPNLDLEGDMLDSLTFKNVPGGVKVGVLDETQAAKAHGHNTGFKKHPILKKSKKDLTRKFIPSPKEDFVNEIQRGIDRIVKRKEKKLSVTNTSLFGFDEEPAETTSVEVGNIDELIDRLANG